MRSAAAAIAWEFGLRHRWGLSGVALYLLVLAAVRILILKPGQQVDFEDVNFALLVVVPLTVTFLYFLSVFSFGLSGDLAARQSMYPARKFTLPMTNGALAGLPMLYGTTAMALLWFPTRFLGIWPSGFVIPVFWPALLAASLLAWTQALTWMPYPLPGLRVGVTILWLASMDATVMVALQYKAPESVMLAILAPHVPLAYLTARYAVARGRRGDVPDWRRSFARNGQIAAPVRRDPFPSAARAQAWFEWRQYGRSLPWLVAILLPCELALLFAFTETPVVVFEILAGVLLTPPFMAAFVAATVSSAVTPFIATRPLANASLIAAKLKATIWSTLVTWILVVAAIPVALKLTHTAPIVIGWGHSLVVTFGVPRAVAIACVALFALVASTWKQLVQSLYIGMSGREWIVKASVFVALAVLTIMLPLGHWIIGNRQAMGVLWNVFPWIAAVLVCLKISAAFWIAIRLFDRRLLRGRALLIGALSWDVAVFALYLLLLWIVPAILIRSYILALVAVLAMPLARVAAAPLALAWNRHR